MKTISVFLCFSVLALVGAGCSSGGPSDQELARMTPEEIVTAMQERLLEHPPKPLSPQEKEDGVQAMRRAVSEGNIERVAEFRRGTHEAQGSARIVKWGGRYVLTLSEDFFLKPAPDTAILLSAEPRPDVFSRVRFIENVEVGPLKTNHGGQIYDLPRRFDPTRYQSVIVYSKSFQYLLTFGTLQTP